MIHKDVFKQFEMLFPKYAKKTELWFPAGKNTIRVRLTDKREFVFRYDGMNNMQFETIHSFVEKTKGENK